MSVMRSPPKTSVDEQQSEVSKFADVAGTSKPQRKRKQPGPDCECSRELVTLRKDIKNMFEDFIKTQKEDFSKLYNDIAQINSKVDGLQATADHLVAEHKNITKEVSNLVDKSKETDVKMRNLENDIALLKSQTAFKSSAKISHSEESLMHEIQERALREKNIIICGIPEIQEKDAKKRLAYDKAEVCKILHQVSENNPVPWKVLRIGKYKHDMNRSLKVLFNSTWESKEILRNRNTITNTSIRIFSDKTPAQQKYLKDLREELLSRQSLGEDNLKIKYVNGIPKIINIPKN